MFSLRTHLTAVVFALCTIGWAGAAQAVPSFLNPGFESGGGGTTGNAADWDETNAARASAPGPFTTFAMNLNGDPGEVSSASQTVGGFTIGDTYRLSLQVSNFAVTAGDPNLLSFGVDIGGDLSAFSSVTLGLGNSPTTIANLDIDFAAPTASVLFTFFGQRLTGSSGISDADADRSFIIDNVSLTFLSSGSGGGGPVPEPTSLALLGTGLLVLVGLHRRRKKY